MKMCYKITLKHPAASGELDIHIRIAFSNMNKDTCLMTLQYVPMLTYT